MADLAALVRDFETAGPVQSHTAHSDYLDNLEALCKRMAMMARQDSDIAATWLSRRRPKKGRVPWRERMRLSRRTRGHGRHEASSWLEAAAAIRKWRDTHEEFMDKEEAAQAKDGKS